MREQCILANFGNIMTVTAVISFQFPQKDFFHVLEQRNIIGSLRLLKQRLNQDKNVYFLVLIIKIYWLHSTVTY